MSSIAGDTAPRRRASFADLWAQRETWVLLLLVWAAAVLTRHFVVANTDVSWLLTLGEKVLDGQRPYVDFIEVNPPASIYLYLPGIMIARATGLSPELVTDGLVFIVIFGSLWIAGRVLLEAGLLGKFDKGILIASIAIILAVLPAQAFGEREHIAVALFLPMLAVTWVRATGGRPRLWSLIVAGTGAGAMMVVKPHLALGLVPALVVAAYAARSFAVLFALENWIALAIVAAYGAIVVIAFPEYISNTVPLVSAVYLPVRQSLSNLIVTFPAVPAWVLTLIVIAGLRRRKAWDCLYGILLAGSSGLAAAFFIQGKGWPYHTYPMLALVLFALAFALAERRAETPGRVEWGGWVLIAGFVSVFTFCWMNVVTTVEWLVAPIRQITPHPTMLTITPDVAIGHPLVREVGGTWVASVGSQWITLGVLRQRLSEKLTPEENARLGRYAALDRALLADALRRNKPDVIVVEKAPFDGEAWAKEDPQVAELLRSYSKAVASEKILVLKRTGTAGQAGSKDPARKSAVVKSN